MRKLCLAFRTLCFLLLFLQTNGKGTGLSPGQQICTCFCPPDLPCPFECKSCMELVTTCSCWGDICTSSKNVICQGGSRPIASCAECCFGIGFYRYQCEKPCSYFTSQCEECKNGFFGSKCDPCPAFNNMICSGYGTCSDGISGSGKCTCRSGYGGPDCRYSSEERCNGHGVIKEDGNCNCDPGYAEPLCDKCVPNFYGPSCSKECVAGDTCHGHGDCDQSGNCVCQEGLDPSTGCSTCLPFHSSYPDCIHCEIGVNCIHGKCSNQGKCECDPGFQGDKCDECAAGYVGSSSCIPCPGLHEHTWCSGHGNCVASGNTSSCICADGFAGYACEYPHISIVQPLYGLAAGGDLLTITGSQLQGVDLVLLGGRECLLSPPGPSASSTVVTCVTPAGSGAKVLLVVSRGVEQSNVVLWSYFPPTIIDISPTVLPNSGGLIAVTGTNFGQPSNANFSAFLGCDGEVNIQLSVLTFDDSRALLMVPSGTGANLRLRLNITQQIICSSSTLRYIAPVITSIHPERPDLANKAFSSRQHMVVRGTGFGKSSGVLSARFVVGANIQTEDLSAPFQHNETYALVRVPYGCGADIELQLSAGPSLSTVQASNVISFSFAAPIINYSSPLSPAQTEGGFILEISGRNLNLDAPDCIVSVRVDGRDCRVLDFMSTSLLHCVAPEGDGIAEVQVSVAGLVGSPAEFSYSPPSITSAVSKRSDTIGGYPLLIEGMNFGLNPTVKIGDSECLIRTKNSSRIVCSVPEGQGKAVPVVVHVSDQSAYTQFSYAAPAISDIYFVKASTTGGDILTIWGSNFGTNPTVTIDGSDCGVVRRWHDTIACSIGPGQGANLEVVVNAGERASVSSFSYDQPTLTSVSPDKVPPIPNQKLRLLGSNFGVSPQVLYGSATLLPSLFDAASNVLEVYTVQTDTADAMIPIQVRAGSQTSNTLNVALKLPTIVSLSQTSGGSEGGYVLSVFGDSLGDSASIFFDSVECPDTFSNHLYANCTVPERVMSARVEVSIDVQGRRSNRIPFVYEDASISSVVDPNAVCTPQGTGIVDCPFEGGIPIEIHGANLKSSNSSVQIAGRDCSISSLSASLIVCELPLAGNPFWAADVVVTAFGERFVGVGLVGYVGPTISDQTPSLLASSTFGEERLTVSGTGFGALASELSVFYGPTEAPTKYEGVVDASTHSSTAFAFTLAAGVGNDLTITAVVKGVASRPSTSTISYPPPELISGTMSLLVSNLAHQHLPRSVIGTSTNGDILYAAGLHLGSDMSEVAVVLLHSASGAERSCVIDSLGVTLDYTNFTCQIEPGEGGPFKMLVRVPPAGSSMQQTIGLDQYSYPSGPIVERVSGCSDSGNSTELCPTAAVDENKQNIRITIYGKNFASDTTVRVGGDNCLDPVLISDGPHGSGSSTLSCLLPAGAGLNIAVKLSSDLYESLPKNVLSYAPPSISKVYGCSAEGCRREGSDQLTIDGANFGASMATVLVGGTTCSNVEHVGTGHTRLRCIVPPGTGSERSVIVLQNEGEATASSIPLSYRLCEAGRHRSSNSTSCIACAPGRSAPTKGQKSCLACGRGRFSTAAQPYCQKCEPGRYANTISSSSCIACPVGRFSFSEAQSSCSMCSFGTFANVEGLTTCTKCAPGRFQHSAGASFCEECAVGAIAATPGMSQCTTCTEGQFSNSTGLSRCFVCDAGRAGSGGTCVLCKPGRYTADLGQVSCKTCPAGRFSLLGATECIDCSKGTFAEREGSASCQPCPLGRFADTRAATLCSACTSGRFGDELGMSNCKDCKPGTAVATLGQVACEPCSAGFFAQHAAQSSCDLCQSGRYSNTSSLTKCLDCEPGRFTVSLSSKFCEKCPPGTFAKDVASATCEACEDGSFSAVEGARSCTLCPIGTHSKDPNSQRSSSGKGSTFCMDCEPGFFSPRPGSAECSACSVGRISNEARSGSCKVCPAGSYQSLTGQTICFPCSVGRSGTNPGLEKCMACPSGRFASIPGLTKCLECPAGKFSVFTNAMEDIGPVTCQVCGAGRASTVPGSESCSACSPGRFTAGKGWSSCALCPIGRFSDGIERTSCTECAAGRYADEKGQLRCKPCEVGRAGSRTGTSSCSLCPVGRFQDTTGQQDCKDCTPSTYQDTLGRDGCKSCQSGRFSNSTGSVSCTKCPKGSFSDNDGSSCQLCTPGRYSSTLGQHYCLECPKGSMSDKFGASQCTLCGPGTVSSSQSDADASSGADVGATACVECDIGEFAEGFGSQECSKCPKGRYSSTKGSNGCMECPQGTKAPIMGMKACELCTNGTAQVAKGQSVCIACESGAFASKEGSALCSLCPQGRFSIQTSSHEGASDCQYCDAGRYAALLGQRSCLDCGLGSFSGFKGAVFCEMCAPGRHQPKPAQTSCMDCEPGSFTAAIGQASCVDCDVGHFSNTSRSTMCLPCPSGRFAASKGLAVCEKCGPGRFAPVGQDSCLLCGEGTISTGWGASSCKACPPFSHSTGSRTECHCNEGYFESRTASNEKICLSCPEGATCNTAANISSMKANIGYWRSSNQSVQFYKCTLRSLCPGGVDMNSICREHHTGPMCGLCEPGFYLNPTRICTECKPDSVSSFIISVVVIVAVLAAQFHIMLRTGRPLLDNAENYDRKLQHDALDNFALTEQISRASTSPQASPRARQNAATAATDVDAGAETSSSTKQVLTYKLKILVGFAQISSNLAVGIELQWPDTFRRYIATLDASNTDYIRWTSAECVHELDFYRKLVIMTLLPLFVLAVLGMIYFAVKYSILMPSWTFYRRKRFRRQLWKIVLFLMFLIYPGVSSMILRTFVCKKVEGTYFLLADFRLQCFDSTWYKYAGYGAVMVAVYPIGIPLFLFFMLYKYRTQLNDPAVRAQVGFLYDGFHRDVWYFEIVDMMHKLMMTGGLAFIPSHLQGTVGMLILISYLIINLLVRPYRSAADDRLHIMCQCELFLLMLGAQLFASDQVADDRTKVTVTLTLVLVVLAFLAMFSFQVGVVGMTHLMDFKRKAHGNHAPTAQNNRELMTEEMPMSIVPTSRASMTTSKQ